ncbi:hypothetical protein GCM10007424_19890 [Flavobacterium suaedae]|uniref:Uncharacterized protein n=1 Tax=Flavobacterium suaedae TaxID=1767027 RepID=A0ABQ1JZR8_9FLAO|nr:hypothetical protein [Flavobacterium suaedae]GGB79743.1 hypothetical protein GCM10007424_19890 [Flavobacterium suaedae]
MKTKLLLKATFVALLFIACSKEQDSETNNSNLKSSYRAAEPDDNYNYDIMKLQGEALKEMTQHFEFSADRDDVRLETENGVRIEISTSSLTIGGERVQGDVILEYVEIFKRSSMAIANKTTMGISDEQTDEIEGTDLEPLVTGGEFFINITTVDGEQLDNGADITLTVPADLTGGPGDVMTAWDGIERENGDVAWEEEEDAEPLGTGEQGYYLFNPDEFGWSNIDRFWDYSGATTTIQVDVPAGYDDTNCSVYLATVGEQNILAPLDTYDASTELFSEHYGQVPVGLDGYIVFVSGTTSQWEYAIIPVTFAPNDIIVVDAGDIVTGSQADVENAIDALP